MEPDWRDQHGRGTAVAGLVVSVAPQVEMVAARVLDASGMGSMDDVAAAVAWCVSQGCHIINLSLGSRRYHAGLEVAIRVATEAQVVVIAAAGNSGPGEGTVLYPAALPDPVAVAALEDTGDWPTWFSSWGDEVDVAGPGDQVLAAALDGGWISWRGTSFAAPLVAGAAALLWEAWIKTYGRPPLEARVVG